MFDAGANANVYMSTYVLRVCVCVCVRVRVRVRSTVIYFSDIPRKYASPNAGSVSWLVSA